jgi:uncharacterized protein (DUF433 family)
MTLYFKRHWNETTGDEPTDTWGTSDYYFETDEEGNVLKQIQVFVNGNCLKYDLDYLDDKYGGLSEVPLDLSEFKEFQISQSVFNKVWEDSTYTKFPEIVCTPDTLWGQPRLEGTRLAVGDIVSLTDTYDTNINSILVDFDLSLQQIRQALHYCKILQCKNDNPVKFCHNCTLRVTENNESEGDEQDNWKRANLLFQKYFTN